MLLVFTLVAWEGKQSGTFLKPVSAPFSQQGQTRKAEQRHPGRKTEGQKEQAQRTSAVTHGLTCQQIHAASVREGSPQQGVLRCFLLCVVKQACLESLRHVLKDAESAVDRIFSAFPVLSRGSPWCMVLVADGRHERFSPPLKQ